MKSVLAVLVTAAFFTGCASSGVKKYSDRSTLFSNEGEFLGEMVHLQLRAMFPLERRPELWRTVRRISAKIGKHAAADKREYRVVVVDHPMVNAFALPNGRVYITRGLLEFIPNEDALAGVIAHEFAHVELGHYEKSLDRAAWGLSPAGLLLVFFSQDQESEADRRGLELMSAAGYSPSGLGEFFEKIRQMERRAGWSAAGIFSTHPTSESRRRAVEAWIQANRSKIKKPAGPARSGPDFVVMRERLFQDRESYQSTGESEDGAGRFRFSDPKRHGRFAEAAERTSHGYDLLWADSVFASIAKEPGLSARERGALASWRARAAYNLGDLEAARAHNEIARREWPELERVSWMAMSIQGQEGDVGGAQKAWMDRALSDACRRDLECQREAMRFAMALGSDSAVRAKVAENYRKLVNERGRVESWDQGPLSYGLTAEIWERLHWDVDGRPPAERPTLKSFQPSRYLLDWQEIEGYFDRKKMWINERERGVVLSFDIGLSGYGDVLPTRTGMGMPISIALGYQVWPWTFGAVLDGHSLPAPGGGQLEAIGGGVYGQYDWMTTRWRPYTAASVHYSSWLHYPESSPDDSTAVGGGWSAALKSGVAWWYSGSGRRNGTDSFLRLGLGARYLAFRPFLGAPGSGLSWEVDLGATFRFNFYSEKIETEAEASGRLGARPPEVF